METAAVATLQISYSNGSEETLELLDGQSVKAGRDDSNDLVLNDVGISRFHAVFSASLNGVALADLGSTNGTFVNSERITALQDLSSGDIVNIGGARIKIEIQAEQAINSLSGSFASRSMTAQLKAVPLAVLVVSVANYDKMVRTLPPNDISPMLLHWSKGVNGALQEYGGKLDKIIGASIVAIWSDGAERELAARAAHAALRILDLTDELSQGRWPHSDKCPWECTVVLSSGRGLSGTVGSSEQSGPKSFTMLGDPVNIAFRLMELVAKLGENLIVAGPTAPLLEGAFTLSKIIRVKIKGFEDGLDTFTIKTE